jgi:hypothetical protein
MSKLNAPYSSLFQMSNLMAAQGSSGSSSSTPPSSVYSSSVFHAPSTLAVCSPTVGSSNASSIGSPLTRCSSAASSSPLSNAVSPLAALSPLSVNSTVNRPFSIQSLTHSGLVTSTSGRQLPLTLPSQPHHPSPSLHHHNHHQQQHQQLVASFVSNTESADQFALKQVALAAALQSTRCAASSDALSLHAVTHGPSLHSSAPAKLADRAYSSIPCDTFNRNQLSASALLAQFRASPTLSIGSNCPPFDSSARYDSTSGSESTSDLASLRSKRSTARQSKSVSHCSPIDFRTRFELIFNL